MSLRPSQRALVRMLASLAIALCFLAVYALAYSMLSSYQVTVGSERAQASVSIANASAASQAAATLASTGDARTLLNAEFVPVDGEASAIGSLESLGRSLGLTVSTLSVGNAPNPADAKTKPLSQELVLTLSTVGTWGATATYLGELENLPYASTIASAAISQQLDAKGNPTGAWQGAFTVNLIQLN